MEKQRDRTTGIETEKTQEEKIISRFLDTIQRMHIHNGREQGEVAGRIRS